MVFSSGNPPFFILLFFLLGWKSRKSGDVQVANGKTKTETREQKIINSKLGGKKLIILWIETTWQGEQYNDMKNEESVSLAMRLNYVSFSLC